MWARECRDVVDGKEGQAEEVGEDVGEEVELGEGCTREDCATQGFEGRGLCGYLSIDRWC